MCVCAAEPQSVFKIRYKQQKCLCVRQNWTVSETPFENQGLRIELLVKDSTSTGLQVI